MMKNFAWKSKGQTLLWLENKLLHSSVPQLIVFTYKEWIADSDKILNKIKHQFLNKYIAIRSSSLNEDSLDFSNAGAFESHLNINVKNLKLIINSISRSSLPNKYSNSLMEINSCENLFERTPLIESL